MRWERALLSDADSPSAAGNLRAKMAARPESDEGSGASLTMQAPRAASAFSRRADRRERIIGLLSASGDASFRRSPLAGVEPSPAICSIGLLSRVDSSAVPRAALSVVATLARDGEGTSLLAATS